MASLIQKLDSASHSPEVCDALLGQLAATLAGRKMRFMEVCGTHTVSIFQSGLRSLLPKEIIHISGPGCPVCVTHDSEIALLLEVANNPDVILATFGDLLRVPGPGGKSLKHARTQGAKIEIVYSPLDAVGIAKANPQNEVVFAGIGFETTAPTVAAAILTAKAQNLANFSVLAFHKLVPPALNALLAEDDSGVDAFLLPGHVATVTGLAPFTFLAADFGKPAVVGGFEPADILLALCDLATMFVQTQPGVANDYQRAVDNNGNARARKMLDQVFQKQDAFWRGLGLIPESGLGIRTEFAEFDAMAKLDLQLPKTQPIKGCLCGAVLKGKIQPPQCPLFATTCTPANPVGPCMVSTEGSCAAWHKYGDI